MIRFLLAFAICLLEGLAQPVLWTQYLNGDDILAVAVSGQVAWVGTEGGGMVRLDLASGDARFFNTSNSGLYDNTVTQVQVDDLGRVWVLSRFGTLQRFDGTDWISISHSGQVRGFLVLRSGEAVACREGSLQVFDGVWRQVDTLRQADFHCELAQGPGNELWLAHSRQEPGNWAALLALTRYDTRTWNPTWRLGTEHPQLKFMQPLVSLLPDPDGTLWAVSGSALLHIGDSLLAAPEAAGEGGTIASVIRGGDGSIWVGGNRGLARRDGGQWTHFTSSIGQLPSDRVKALDWHGNRILVGTDSGLASFTPDEWRPLKTSATALPSNHILSLYTDPGGDQWIGTRGGTVRRRGDAWTLVREGAASRPPDGVTQFLAARDGGVWMATLEDGVIRLRNGAWSRFPLADGGNPPSLFSGCMAEDGAGRIWVALGDRLARYDGTRWTYLSVTELGLGTDWALIHSLEPDGAGGLWGAGDGLAHFDGAAWRAVNRDPVAQIAWEPVRGRLFGRTLLSLAMLEGNNWKVLPVAKDLQPNEYQVSVPVPDRRGRVWFQYSDTGFSGLGWTEGDSLRLLPDIPPFQFSLLGFDKDGRLWGGSEEGLAMRNNETPLGRSARGAGRKAHGAGRRFFPGDLPGESTYDVSGRSRYPKRIGSRAEKVYLAPGLHSR